MASLFDDNVVFLEDAYPDFYQQPFAGQAIHVESTPQIPHITSNYTQNPWSSELLIRQTFYEGPKKCDCCINWVEKQPTQMPEHAKQKYEQAAVVLFNKKDHKAEKSVVGGLIAMKPYLVEVQSPVLVEILRPILEELGTLTGQKDKIKVFAPFRDLFFAYPKVVGVRDSLAWVNDKRQHLNLLIELLDELFSEMSSEVTELHEKKMITSKYVWTIFPKNIIVYSRRYGYDRLFKVTDIAGDLADTNPSWYLSCDYHQFDGTTFGKVDITIRIPSFNGARLISNLPVYPTGFHEDSKIESKIFERSRKLLNFQGIVHCEHDGAAILATEQFCDTERGLDAYESDDEIPSTRKRRRVQRQHVPGRVVIDAFGMGRFVPDKQIEVRPIELTSDDHHHESDRENLGGSKLPLSHLDSHNKRRPAVLEQRQARDVMLKNHDALLILSPLLPGYSLRLNEWYWFSVDRLRNVRWNVSSFEQLVLSQENKSLLLNTVKNHVFASKMSDDIITGKGQGIVVLLSGPSGTGKTLTAEALAEVTKRPLLRLQASSFLRGPGVRQLLTSAFELSEEWNALMLVDEADDFISDRALVETISSEVASGILRSIEYFRGVLFFTANLFLDLDEAFKSRIHIHLRYTALDFPSRQALWETFVQLIKTRPLPGASSSEQGVSSGTDVISIKLGPDDWKQLAQWRLNGRDIKNIVKIVYLRCISERKDLTCQHLLDGIQISSPDAQRTNSSEEEKISSEGTEAPHQETSTAISVDKPSKKRRIDD